MQTTQTQLKPGFTLGLLVGTLVGASLGTLLAPGPGTSTRSRLAFETERLRSRLRELKETLPEMSHN